MAVSAVREPGRALIGTGTPYNDDSQWPLYHRQLEAIATRSGGIRRPGSAALDLCWVAAGVFDGFWEIRLAPWDVAAGALIVREAGGVVTDFSGATDIVRHASIVAGNPAMHAWLRETLGSLGSQLSGHVETRRMRSQLQ